MDYIVFLITLQLPFVYLFWRFFKRYEDRANTNFRFLTKRIHQTNSLFETLRTMSDTNRASLKKNCEELEEEINRLKVTVHRYNQFYEERLKQLERCTGVSPSASLASSSFLKDKHFS